jgi:hypothetical protein
VLGPSFWKLPTAAVNRTSAIAIDFLLRRFKFFLQKFSAFVQKNVARAHSLTAAVVRCVANQWRIYVEFQKTFEACFERHMCFGACHRSSCWLQSKLTKH